MEKLKTDDPKDLKNPGDTKDQNEPGDLGNTDHIVKVEVEKHRVEELRKIDVLAKMNWEREEGLDDTDPFVKVEEEQDDVIVHADPKGFKPCLVDKKQCQYCDYRSDRKYFIERHVNNIHEMCRRYQCPDCDFACLHPSIELHQSWEDDA